MRISITKTRHPFGTELTRSLLLSTSFKPPGQRHWNMYTTLRHFAKRQLSQPSTTTTATTTDAGAVATLRLDSSRRVFCCQNYYYYYYYERVGRRGKVSVFIGTSGTLGVDLCREGPPTPNHTTRFEGQDAL